MAKLPIDRKPPTVVDSMALSAATNGVSSPIRHVPLSYDNAESHPSALRLILTLFPEWEHAKGDIEFVQFTDGITNTVRSTLCVTTKLWKATN